MDSPSRLGLHDRSVQLAGRVRKSLLKRLEALAYHVVGLPIALRRIGRHSRASYEDQPANYLHDYYGDAYWALPWGPPKALVSVILWPIGLVVIVWLFTSRNGRAIRDRNGKSIARQMSEQALFAARHAIASYWYYMFELYLTERSAAAALYLTAHETIGPAYSLLQPRADLDSMNDKVWFAAYCKETGVAAVPVFFLLSGGKMIATDGLVDLPAMDIFVKPRQGNGGRNTERWDYLGDGRYRSSRGVTLARNALAEALAAQSLKGDFVVQPRAINHPAVDDVSNGALATVRVLTCRNEHGGFEATNAAFRMAIGRNNVIDNFHAGGIASNVDLKTGVIGSATDMGLRPEVGWRDVHPVSGAPIRGRRLPLWRDVIDLAGRAHEAFPHRVVVGWDVAMLADGSTCIVEGNTKPDLDIHQRVEARPLGDRRIAYLLALHVHRALERESREER
ncbi:MAG: sugar-transfer associated ATP-grasp domain-containing protein [Hyphomicrobiales bacterium]